MFNQTIGGNFLKIHEPNHGFNPRSVTKENLKFRLLVRYDLKHGLVAITV